MFRGFVGPSCARCASNSVRRKIGIEEKKSLVFTVDNRCTTHNKFIPFAKHCQLFL